MLYTFYIQLDIFFLWNKLYLKGNSIDLGGAIISSSAGAVSLPAGSTIGGSNIGAVQIQSDWTQVATITVASGSFIVGTSYIIASVGSTNFTLIGSANNTVGTTFSATGVGIGSGTATTDALDYIKNKPTIPAAQIQSDWNQATSGALEYIKNKI